MELMEPALKELEKKLQIVFGDFKNELAGIRANRPSPKLVEDVKVDYFGQKLAIKQLATVSVVPPRELVVNVWDKGAVAGVAKAIETASVGFSASIDGNLIRINLPVMTNERRQELVKTVKAIAERERIKMRLLRDDCRRQAKALKDEDEKYLAFDKIQKIVDKYNEQIEGQLNNKIREINE